MNNHEAEMQKHTLPLSMMKQILFKQHLNLLSQYLNNNIILIPDATNIL